MVGKVNAAVRDAAQDWGRNIEWRPLHEGWVVAKDQNKPIMVVVQKKSCRFCTQLAQQFAQSKDMEDMSKDFVMIVLDHSEADNIKAMTPDGQYYPRIMFFSPKGTPLKHIVYSPNSSTKYAYGNIKSLQMNMRTVAMSFPGNTES